MNMSSAETASFLEEFKSQNWPSDVDCIIAPPSTYIKQISDAESIISAAAQNCHNQPSGAYTGEISVGMIQDAGAQYCLVGHSERRQYFGYL